MSACSLKYTASISAALWRTTSASNSSTLHKWSSPMRASASTKMWAIMPSNSLCLSLISKKKPCGRLKSSWHMRSKNLARMKLWRISSLFGEISALRFDNYYVLCDVLRWERNGVWNYNWLLCKSIRSWSRSATVLMEWSSRPLTPITKSLPSRKWRASIRHGKIAMSFEKSSASKNWNIPTLSNWERSSSPTPSSSWSSIISSAICTRSTREH